MKYSIEWLDQQNNAVPEEAATVADVRLFLNQVNVTEHLNGRVPQDHITIAMYGLAYGLARDWWKIFGLREGDVSLISYRSGYVVPDIRLRFDGAAFEIAAEQRVYDNPGVRFWAGPAEVIPRQEAEAHLGRFIEEILDRLKSLGMSESGAHTRWARVKSSLNNPAEALFCEAAGSLALDPYQIDGPTADFIEDAESVFRGQALVEFVAGSAGVRRPDLLDWVRRMLADRSSHYRVPDLESIVREAAGTRLPDLTPQAWAIGYKRARQVRQVLNLDQADRFSSFRDIAKHLGAGPSFNVAPKAEGIRALRTHHSGGCQIHLRNHGESDVARSQHLFAMARALGDAACFLDDEQVAPINDLHNAYRQAAGRAFAAEFLAPVDEIRSMQADQHDLMSIADEFSVAPHVIERQIENSARIAKACSEY
ncbi:hypothetical protein FIU28_13710 [Tardiphaga sp. vice154]|uniref:hypothetical protein n=1 Tax=Tardiphaga sp. vice154 TaxID=2592814 RepID=UPI001162D885|nr:hypothetical protein [Tardiphaga sp. vice154]QDM22094.1 hypothetical protein FIU28_13710 [Tardiphaga sp. vice154]